MNLRALVVVLGVFEGKVVRADVTIGLGLLGDLVVAGLGIILLEVFWVCSWFLW